MKDDSYIISIKPKSRQQQTRDKILTLMMWGIYIYLWIPLITFAAWFAGFDRFYEVMIVYGGFDVVMSLLDWYGLAIVTIAACIVSWSGINYRRFHNKNRRTEVPSAKAEDISEFFRVSKAEVERAQVSRRLVIELDEPGFISEITHYAYVGGDGEANHVKLE
jgi:biofilm PGA synthesis protein PgaD